MPSFGRVGVLLCGLKYKKGMEQFTEEQITKIKHLNDLLRKEEQRVRSFSLKTLDTLRELESIGMIDDYNFDTLLEAYSENEECNKRNNVEEGDPIYKDYLSIFQKDTDDMFFTDDWNELYAEHPLRHIPFCYSMHCIYSHSHLTWEDILLIDDVWIDIKVDYQFMINTKK
jgi:hypothetical protein